MPPRVKKPVEDLRAVAEDAGYVSPYPAPGNAPEATVDERCDTCGWTLFVTMRCEVYCINAKCAEYQRDLTREVPDVEPVPVDE